MSSSASADPFNAVASTLPDAIGNVNGSGSDSSQPGQTEGPTSDIGAGESESPRPVFTLTAIISNNPVDADLFGRVYDLTSGGFREAITIEWTGDQPTGFEPSDVEVEWIANVGGRPEKVASMPSKDINIDETKPPGAVSIISMSLSLRDGLSRQGHDMFLVLKYPDITNQNLGKIVQISPVFILTDKAEDLKPLRDKLDERRGIDPDLRTGSTIRDGQNIFPSGSVCNPLDPKDNTCVEPTTSASPTSSSKGDNTSPALLDGSSSRGAGLSTGAKIGIGVGAALGALLILALVAFLLFRRRRRRRGGDHVHSAATYDASARQAIPDYMADKEMTGPRIAESPYSEDGRGSGLLASHNHNDFSNEFQHESSPAFAPYSDAAAAAAAAAEGPHAVTSDARVESRAGARSSSPDRVAVVPRTVAHLVEEGMTQEQIRTLEEEERALDRAIEQAGHGHGHSNR